MAKQYKVLVNTGKTENNKAFDIQQRAGDRGQPVRIKAQAGTKYQLQELGKDKNVAPDYVRAQRKGKNLEITFEGGSSPDVIIEDYYTEMPAGYNGVIGQAENGSFYEYIPEDPIRKIAQADVGRRIDLEQAQVRVDNARLSMQQRKSDLVQAIQKLQRFWKGEMDARPMGLNEAVSAGGPLGALPASIEEATSYVKDDLPLLAQYRAQVKAAEAAVRQAKGLHWPTVDLVSSRQFNTNVQRFDTLTQVQLNMPVYNGFGTEAQVEAAVAQQRAAQAALDEARLTQQEKVATAWQEWASSTSRARLGATQSDVGDKVVEGYRQQFRLARRSLLDLLNIQADSFNYRSGAMAAMHDERINRARLLASMGSLAERFEPGHLTRTR